MPDDVVTSSRRLSGRVAVVTGAGAGTKAALGAVFARALAAEGARVVVADTRDCSEVAGAIVEGGGSAHAVHVDVADEQSVQAMMGEARRRYGRLDILVNNAAVGSNIPPVALEDLSVADFDAAMAVNVRGLFLCCKSAVPLMKANAYGKIVNIGSSTIVEGLPHRLHYLASKGATMAMTRALARELGPAGIRVNTLAPGLVMNDAVAASMASRPGALDAVCNSRSLKEDLLPEGLVGTLVFLASAESDSITGQFLVVDNGGALS